MTPDAEDLPSLITRFFPQLTDPDLLAEISRIGELLAFQKGDIIMDYGSYVRFAPLLIRGCVKVIRAGDDGEELLLYYLNGGESCSMAFSCCMAEKQSIIRTVAEEDTQLISIPLREVNRWMDTYPSWRHFVMRMFEDRMLELVQTIDNIAFKKMDERLWEYLLNKAAALDTQRIQCTHQEIAYDLNASREAVSRLLKQLEKMGRLRLGRNEIELVG